MVAVRSRYHLDFGFVKQIFLEIHLTFPVPSLCARPMFFVLLVLVNGDVGDFHDDGSFTHGEPGARIFGGLRRQSCNAKKKPLHVFLFDRIQSRFVTFCGISFAWYI